MILTYLLIAYLIVSMVLVIYYLDKTERLKNEITIIKITNKRYKDFVDALINEVKSGESKRLIVVEGEINEPFIKYKIVIMMSHSILRKPTLYNSIILFHPEATHSFVSYARLYKLDLNERRNL